MRKKYSWKNIYTLTQTENGDGEEAKMKLIYI